MCNIAEKEQELFKIWKQKQKSFIEDGVVSPKEFCNQSIKVLYILKEANDEDSSTWNLKQFLLKGGRWQTWNNITRWQFGIENLENNALNRFDEVDKITVKEREYFLRRIAVVNLKKTGGGSRSNMKLIAKSAEENSELLRDQISLYSPDIIICCGKGIIANIVKENKLIKGLSDWRHTSNGIRYALFDNKILIDYYHPQVRNKKLTKEKLYLDLIKALKEIKASVNFKN